MKRPKIPRLFIILFTFLTLLFHWNISTGQGQTKQGHEKIESRLFDLKLKYNRLGLPALGNYLGKGLLRVDQEKVVIFIYLKEGADTKSIYESIKMIGGEIIKSGVRVLKAKVPFSGLEPLAQLESVSFIKLPDQPITDSYSQGVQLTGASILHSSAITGDGVKVCLLYTSDAADE